MTPTALVYSAGYTHLWTGKVRNFAVLYTHLWGGNEG